MPQSKLPLGLLQAGDVDRRGRGEEHLALLVPHRRDLDRVGSLPQGQLVTGRLPPERRAELCAVEGAAARQVDLRGEPPLQVGAAQPLLRQRRAVGEHDPEVLVRQEHGRSRNRAGDGAVEGLAAAEPLANLLELGDVGDGAGEPDRLPVAAARHHPPLRAEPLPGTRRGPHAVLRVDPVHLATLDRREPRHDRLTLLGGDAFRPGRDEVVRRHPGPPSIALRRALMWTRPAETSQSQKPSDPPSRTWASCARPARISASRIRAAVTSANVATAPLTFPSTPRRGSARTLIHRTPSPGTETPMGTSHCGTPVRSTTCAG